MKKKLLIVTDVMSLGGVERVIINTLNGIDYSIFDVSLFVMYKTDGEDININKIPEKVKLLYLFKKPVKAIYQRILYYLFMFFPKVINKLIVKEDYDIIVTTKDVFSYPISVNKCYKVMWIHGGLEHLETETVTLFVKLKRLVQKLHYKKFNKIILLTSAAKKRFGKKYDLEEKCHVLFNPINSNEITKLSNERVSDYDFYNNVTIVCSCRLSIEKGVDRLLNISGKLLNDGYNFNILILGDGPDKGNLKNIISNNILLSDKVTLLGYKDNPFKYLSKSSIYVSPSLTEGFALSIAEAIILDLPVLSTHCNGPAEILDNGKYGLLVENSEKGLYEGLKLLLSKPELVDYYIRKSKQRKNFFAYEKNIRLFEKLITGG